jgi:putative FmdB family regulatory protein
MRYNSSFVSVASRRLSEQSMPIYEYRCGDCGHQLEALQKLSDSPLTDCPACGKSRLSKLVSAAGFQLKGSGWYATDFKSSGAKPAANANGEAKSNGSEGKAEAKSEAKSESKPESKSEASSTSSSSSGGCGSGCSCH